MTRDYTSSPNPTQFRRSRTDRVIAGICGGLAERFGWDPLLVRIIAIGSFFFFGPFTFFAYMIAWLLTPGRRPAEAYARGSEEEAFWRGVSDKPRATFGNLKYTYMDLEERLRRLERDVTSEEWRLRKEFRDLENRQ